MSNFLANFISLGFVVKLQELLPVLATTIIFVFIGLVVFAIAFFIVVKVAPFSVKKEIEDDQNTALAIIIGAIILGIALIISAAIQGDSPVGTTDTGSPSTATQAR
jgi:putative membrane protein